MRIRNMLLSAVAVVTVAGSVAFAGNTALAQGPGGMGIGAVALGICSTTNYTEIAAAALGMTAAELRLALVSGQRLEEIAASKNVDIATVQAALEAAQVAELDQAVKDGLITAEVAEAMKNADAAVPGNDDKNNNDDGNNGPSIRIRRVRIGVGVSASNVTSVKPIAVAAQAIGVSCADLVKQMQQGQSIATVATSKNVQLQTVIDAVTKAYQDALKQDVTEGLITEAQATARSKNLIDRVLMLLSQSGGMMIGRGGFDGPFGGPVGGRGGQPGNNDGGKNGQPGGPNGGKGGSDGQPNDPASTPEATPAA